MSEIKSGNSYRFLSYSDGKYLNILTSTTPANNKNVTTYSLNSSDMCQVWKCVSHSNGSVSGMLMKSERDNAFSLDRYRGSSNYDNADVYATATTTADLKDQLVTFVSATQGYYRIKLAYADLYLTVTSTNTTGGHDVRWKALTGNTDQLWLPETYYSSQQPATTVPVAIANKTFYIRNVASKRNLNVYGNDTVANERDVTIYDKENCKAQKWIAKQTNAGAKLFTTINESFALNIHTTDNKCTMYTARGNDSDSVLRFESTGNANTYRIAVNSHNKYLAAESTANNAAVIWKTGTNGNTEWQFMTETDFENGQKALEEQEKAEKKAKIETFMRNTMQRLFLPTYIDSFVEAVSAVVNGVNVSKEAEILKFVTEPLGICTVSGKLSSSLAQITDRMYNINVSYDSNNNLSATTSAQIQNLCNRCEMGTEVETDLQNKLTSIATSSKIGNIAVEIRQKEPLELEFAIIVNAPDIPLSSTGAKFASSLSLIYNFKLDSQADMRFKPLELAVLTASVTCGVLFPAFSVGASSIEIGTFNLYGLFGKLATAT